MAFARRGRASAARPSRQWTELQSTFTLNVTATAATPVWGLQAPAPAAGLTALPPEDVVLMRIRGSFNCSITATASWTLALTVQDTTWTPGTFAGDSDKRLLWTRSFTPTGAGNIFGDTGLQVWDLAGTPLVAHWNSMLDISPKVKLESGQALYLVAYELTGTATLTVSTAEMRMLWQVRKRR